MTQDWPSEPEPDDSDPKLEFVEVDPSGRYGRYKEVLGKGAFKKVYRAFDEWEGIEVAWNQVKVVDLLRNVVDLERLYSEVHLLKTLKHKNIIKFYNSWIDTKNEHINFITEIFTSGNLRQYRKKHKHVDVRALKKWSRQILEGLSYLHSHDPPIIHRDLKCDNIFVNGNQGEVKIGDLGLAALLRKAHSAHSVIGTPEFMAPELYEEEYNELVDIYAFGMCLLELMTLEYPYVECANAAQIYKKVTTGIKPASLVKVKDPAMREFIEKCIAKVSDRLSAKELLLDPFLQTDDDSVDRHHFVQLNSAHSGAECNTRDLCFRYPLIRHVSHQNLLIADDDDNQLESDKHPQDSVLDGGRDFMVQGQRKDLNTIFLKLRIADSSGQGRNIHFPFDIEVDTSISVASEMVEELDLTDHDVSVIAEMINSEIRSHIPEWAPRELSGEFSGSGAPEDAPRTTNNFSPLVLERLPSGRKYWSNSPKASGASSPLPNLLPADDSIASWLEENSQSHKDVKNSKYDSLDDCASALGNGNIIPLAENTDGVIGIIKKLEHILDEQIVEMDELKKKHDVVVSDLLQGLPLEIRLKVLNVCDQKKSEHNSTKRATYESSSN